ncbi:hypothetical protein H4219_001840 [Mycoemilia scoparia]|uniref:Dolichyl-phosphate-mannose--protein mannosyltransferase n=1 Tax=Mycoemilia scoparia TaxID=417184 RepID=A0A9W8A2P1_9FUNG|nr:hypothetical protein H4219_001840 [Mycoemilia scoparia]
MAYSDTMRSRKQPGAAVVYDDSMVLNGEPTRLNSNSEDTDIYPNEKALQSNNPETDDRVYGYEKKDLSWKQAQSRVMGDMEKASSFKITKQQWIVLGVITLIAAYIRLWRLGNPHSVVFDEVHFGKFAGKYINGTYFFDVHPPLAKMMFAWTGRFVGYDGVFDFKTIGLDYLAAKVPYVGMRFLPAILGLLLVPITFITLAAFGHSPDACAFGAIIVTLETALITQSRLILLDSILIFFTASTAMFWGLFFTENRSPFSRRWWVYLALTGVSMGNALSCKWVGLFLFAAIGLWTIKDLWEKLGDLSISLKDYLKHFFARFGCLFVLPLIVYVFWFNIHFRTLHKSGDGNNFMSPEFQNTLKGVSIGHTRRDIYYGARIRIRHDATNGGYLHSHSSSYQTGSKQQQITLYGFRDENNYWTISRTKEDEEKHANSTNPNELQPIKNGDIVRLKHWKTARRLHSHDHRPPVTKKDYHNEVSGYGWEGFEGDSNDYWRVQIIEGDSKEPGSKDRLMSIYSKFRLVHVNQRCALFSDRRKLPEWGFEQIEVTCMKNAKYPKTLWRVETNVHDNPPENAPFASYRKPSLLAKVVEANKVMWRVNNGLTKSHPYESRPISWPILRRGIAFWGEDSRQIYLLGNPIVWWLSSLSIVLFGGLLLLLILRDQRGFHDRMGGIREKYMNSTGWFCLSWLMHYFPFFIMGRQLFLHHYLPALWFSILALVSTLDLFTLRASRKVRQIVFGIVLLWTVRMYFQYGHLAYGTVWNRKGCEHSKWFGTWDYDCRRAPSNAATIATPILPITKAADGDDGAVDEKQAHKDSTIVEKVASIANNIQHHDINRPPPAENIDPNKHEEELNRPVPKMDKVPVAHKGPDAKPLSDTDTTPHKDLGLDPNGNPIKAKEGNGGDKVHNENGHEAIVGNEGFQAPPTVKAKVEPSEGDKQQDQA